MATRSFSDIERIVARYDAATTELDQAVTGRIADSLDASYRNLERELRRLYPTWQSDGSLYAVQRRLLLMEQLGEVLQVVRPEMQGEYERLFTEALQISHTSGATMADELVRSRDPGYPLQEFTTVPIEAAIAQARDGVQRLYRYNDDFKTAVSGVVEQGLLQGWGAQKVARMLRGNEQMQGQFGLAQLKSKAETIARTEIMSAFNTATQERYARNDITHIQWLNSPSERLCSYCLARHGNVYKVGEVSVPAHPRCRCITTAWLPKWAERGWTDDAAIAAGKAQRLEEMAKRGTKPNYGPTYWEKRAGLTAAPQPVWKPGDAVPTPAPKPAAIASPEPKPAKPRPFPPKGELENLEIVRQLGGSTGAELVRDPQTGKLFVRKRGASPDHLREEFAADEAYRALGVAVPKAKLYETSTGPVKLSEFIEGKALSDLTKAEKRNAYKQIQKGFAADALLGNWDVIGLGQDNILIDAKGKPWRIDNGGSLRFRAQGDPKGAAWNDYPTELWSLRDSGRNAQTFEAFGGLGHFGLVQQIEAIAPKRSDLLKALPKELHATVEHRLDEMERVARISRTLEADQWKEDYIGQFTKHSLGLRGAGIIDKLPQRFDLAGGNQVYDENGKLFDNLRGSRSIVRDLEQYISSVGGDYESIIPLWAVQQAGDSWNELPMAVKWHFAQARNLKTDEYWWSGGPSASQLQYDIARNSYGNEVFDTTLAAFHAWNYEQLQKIEMPNNDKAAGTFRLVRTESRSTMQRYGINKGDTGVTMKRGPAESTSMFSRITAVAGGETTVQNVPHHRIIGMYLQERRNGQSNMFLGDYENEAVALLDGVPLDYLKAKKSYVHAKPSYKGGSAASPNVTPPTSSASGLVTPKKLAQSTISNITPGAFQKYWTIAEMEKLAKDLGLTDADVAANGSLKKKTSWIKTFEDLAKTI